MDGSTTLGTASLSSTNSGMQATFTTSSLANGTHSITAVYAGTSSYSGSTSVAWNESVQLSNSLTSLVASAGSIVTGQSLTLTATVTGIQAGATLPTDNVTFMDGSTVLGTVALSGTNAGMQAAFTTTALTIGSHSITAVYSGDSNLAGSTSTVLVETVEVDSTTTTLSSSSLAVLPNQSVTFTATVTGADGGTPTGTVAFYNGSTELGTANLSAASSGAQAVFTISDLKASLSSVTAVYSGDTTYPTSTSMALDILVGVRPADRVLDSRGPMSSERRASSWPTANRAIRAKNNTGDA